MPDSSTIVFFPSSQFPQKIDPGRIIRKNGNRGQEKIMKRVNNDLHENPKRGKIIERRNPVLGQYWSTRICSLLNSQSQWIVGAFTSWLQPTKQTRRRRWHSVAPPMAKLALLVED